MSNAIKEPEWLLKLCIHLAQSCNRTHECNFYECPMGKNCNKEVIRPKDWERVILTFPIKFEYIQ